MATSRSSKATRAKAKRAADELKAVVKDVAAAARTVAKRHGTKKSVTITKGVTTSKDQPNRIRIVRKD